MLFAFMHYRFMRRVCRQELDDVRVFDIRFILMLSVGTVIATIGVSIMYGWHPAIRYGILFITAIATLVHRRTLVQQFRGLLG